MQTTGPSGGQVNLRWRVLQEVCKLWQRREKTHSGRAEALEFAVPDPYFCANRNGERMKAHASRSFIQQNDASRPEMFQALILLHHQQATTKYHHSATHPRAI